jgi:hypothetical protein
VRAAVADHGNGCAGLAAQVAVFPEAAEREANDCRLVSTRMVIYIFVCMNIVTLYGYIDIPA